MKNSKLPFLLILAVVISSCKENIQPCYPVDSNRVQIQVLDPKGNDLLNQSKEGAYQSNDIKIFYERDGKLEEFFDGAQSNMRRNFQIQPPEAEQSNYEMRLVLDTEKTVIQWNAIQADTLIAKITTNNSDYCERRIVSQVFHEGDLKWDSQSARGVQFTIIKDQ